MRLPVWRLCGSFLLLHGSTCQHQLAALGKRNAPLLAHLPARVPSSVPTGEKLTHVLSQLPETRALFAGLEPAQVRVAWAGLCSPGPASCCVCDMCL